MNGSVNCKLAVYFVVVADNISGRYARAPSPFFCTDA